jgi:sulfide:quinone oxidoreductase
MTRDDTTHVLIAGGGVAALEAALALRSFGQDRIDVQLLAPEPHFWYRPLAVAEPFALGEVRHFELAKLATDAGGTFTLGQLVSVDSARRIAYTKPGGAVPYSMLLIACGAVPMTAVEGALTFRGPADTERIGALLAELESGEVRRVAFAVPAGAVWGLPAYELALMSSSWLAARGIDAELALVTPEDEPLQLFGREASAAVRRLLEERGIAVHTAVYAAEARDGELLLVGGDVLAADRVVALPRLQGPRIGGIPQTFEGFIPVDLHGRVMGLSDVYSAGDVTTFSVKQGGIAAQQAAAAAEAIAAAAGLAVEPRPFRPVLRGLLLTGDGPTYLRGELMPEGPAEASQASTEPLWWPPAKIVGRHLAPFLAEQSGAEPEPETTPAPAPGIPVDVELDPNETVARRDRVIEAAVEEALRERVAARVADVMSSDPLVVAPEDTIGEVAERMSDVEAGSALVAEYGRLIGILTSRDMLRALAGRVHSSEARARQWMTADPITVSASTTLEAARILMTEHHVHHLPVVEGERPVGVVSLRDAVRRQTAPEGIGLGF